MILYWLDILQLTQEMEKKLCGSVFYWAIQEKILECIIWHGFTWPVIMSLVQGISTVTKHGKWSYKNKKGTDHLYSMATPSHTT